jgi:hypothetical protein
VGSLWYKSEYNSLPDVPAGAEFLSDVSSVIREAIEIACGNLNGELHDGLSPGRLKF